MSAVVVNRRDRLAIVSMSVMLITLIVAACSDILNGDRTRDASLSIGVTQNGALLTATAGGTAAIVVTGGGHTLDLTSADVVFSEITFEGENVEPGDDDDSDMDSDSDHEGNARFRSGATTVGLPLEGGVVTLFTAPVPLGTFNRLEMDGEFLRVRGTYDGETFDVTVPIDAELELALSPPLEVTSAADPLNVSITVDVESWFRDANGNVIDPRQLATDATLRSEFRNRVGASFNAFEDEDHDADDEDSDSDG